MDRRKIILVSVVALIILLVAYFAGKRSSTKYVLQGTDDPNFDPAPIAEQCFQAFDGIDFSSKKQAALEELEKLTDNQLIMVYNYFNENLADPDWTLLGYIEDEWMWGDLKNDVINRLRNLGAA